ncbi:RNZ1-like protein [Mya arenaria]|uniref:RNZ1-like protein n=1 Tax=Mya arenaria TaxID=6604 RepID=A0ABY7E2X6_MYAAR|nr:RNZ1-like protein [Mya arenaria]
MDHISAVPHHIKKRELNGLKGATYYVPPHLVTPLQEACRQFSVISEDKQVLQNAHIVGISPGDNINVIIVQIHPLGGNHYAIPFPTVHRVASQGYLVYKTTKKLKPEFKDLKGHEIGAKKKDGVDIYDVTETPEVAFTGDTTFQVFTNSVAPPDLFKVKLLIMEATYLDSTEDMEENVDKARQWGHIHLSEIFENAELFKDIENILLIHMSDKYSPSYINKQVFQNLPDVLKGKVRVATLAKERYL